MFEKQSDEQLSKIPPYPMPTPLNKLHLFDHQMAGIRWHIHQEQGNILSYFTEKTIDGRKHSKCEITSTVSKSKPKAVRGGILADDMVRSELLRLSGSPCQGFVNPYKTGTGEDTSIDWTYSSSTTRRL